MARLFNPLWVFLTLALSLKFASASDSESQQQPATTNTLLRIFNDSASYTYHGCFNETTALPGTSAHRALHSGANLVLDGSAKGEDAGMTVQRCLAFCRKGGEGEGTAPEGGYAFAGVEFARECWCAQSLSALSAQYPDEACDLGCEGDKSTACGGNMKISVYVLSAAPSAIIESSLGLLAIPAVVMGYWFL